MLFSSLVFLYLFLPITLGAYFISPVRLKNYTLLFASLIFFAWGGVSFTTILLISIVLNYFFGILIQNYLPSGKAYWWLFLGVASNIMILGVFKYANFITANINSLNNFFAFPSIPQTNILLPVGISFYTFHSLSYLVDIYRGKTTAQKNIFNLALYICMFSQLIAGPIIRYSDVWQQLKSRVHTWQKFSEGIERFLIGLGKKVLLANTFGKVADTIFISDISELTAINAWLGIICYSLQIYCDFAGYSDMAIGLGKMFGFDFKENFNFPYLARSVKEFWRRWHMSLSLFFRDYVYIPLGGSKVKTSRIYLNLLIVFFLTGFWHGASWTFVIWGLFHGFFMVIERLGFEKLLEKAGAPFANIYTLLVVMFAWVLFRAETFDAAILYWQAMFNFNFVAEQKILFASFLNWELFAAFIIAVLGSFGVYKTIAEQINRVIGPVYSKSFVVSSAYDILLTLFYSSILLLCSIYLIASTYNPFIYYKF